MKLHSYKKLWPQASYFIRNTRFFWKMSYPTFKMMLFLQNFHSNEDIFMKFSIGLLYFVWNTSILGKILELDIYLPCTISIALQSIKLHFSFVWTQLAITPSDLLCYSCTPYQKINLSKISLKYLYFHKNYKQKMDDDSWEVPIMLQISSLCMFRSSCEILVFHTNQS